MNKRELRKSILEKEIPFESLVQDGELAARALGDFPLYQNAKTVACYMPMENEPQVQCLCQMVLKDGKRLLLPRVVSKAEMAFFEVASLENLEKSVYGIWEPKSSQPVFQGSVDLMVIPLVAISPTGTRLGHGGGYYDRYLAQFPCATIGVTNKNRLILQLPKEKHDIRVNYYIVDGEIYPCGGK